MKFTRRTQNTPPPAPMAEPGTGADSPAWEMPTGSYDLLGDRFNVRTRARSAILTLAGGAFVATAVLGLQAVSVRSELRSAEQRERTTIERRASLTAELQELIGSGGFTQEQMNDHIASRRSLALAIADRDPAADQLLNYLAERLPASITVTGFDLVADTAPSGGSTTTTMVPTADADGADAPTTTNPSQSAPAGWSVTVNATASSLSEVSAFERIMAEAPMLSGVTVTWTDGGVVNVTAKGTISADAGRATEIAAQFGGAS